MASKLHTHTLPYTQEQLYDLVVDIEKYPEFLPWCLGARVVEKSDSEIVADLIIGYKVFRETFRSKVHLTPKSQIEVEYINGPFHYLKNKWRFKPKGPGKTDIDFNIEFEFKNSFFQSAVQMVFEKAFDQMLDAFETRAEDLYGKSN